MSETDKQKAEVEAKANIAAAEREIVLGYRSSAAAYLRDAATLLDRIAAARNAS